MRHATQAARRLTGGLVIAIAMSVGLTSFTVGTASAAETSSRSVVGKSDVGKITSEVKSTAGIRVSDKTHLIETNASIARVQFKSGDYLRGLPRPTRSFHPNSGGRLRIPRHYNLHESKRTRTITLLP